MIEQRADADHHQVFFGSKNLFRQLWHDRAAGGFDQQIRRAHEFIQ